MDASNNSSKRVSYKAEKLKFCNWILKWACSDYLPTKDDQIPEHTPQIASILQAIGYKLNTIEYAPSELSVNEKNELKIEIYCKKSGLKAILTKECANCSCPNPETTKEAKLWTVSGCGPSASQDNLNKIDQTYSSLLPVLSKENSQIVNDILCKILSMIKETDMNQNKNNTSTSTTSGDSTKFNFSRTRSLDTFSHKPELKRQETWDIDPKTSPPTKTSSPIPELCKSLDQLTLQSDKEQMLADLLTNVKENIEKALVLLPAKNNTFTKKNLKRVSNIKVSPTVTTPTRSTTGTATPDLPIRKTPVKVDGIRKATPKKAATTTIASVTVEKRYLGVASKIGSIRRKPENVTPTTSRPKLMKKDTPYPGQTFLSPNTVGTNDGKRPTLATINKSSSLRGSNSNLSTYTNSSTLAKSKSNIPSFGLKAPTTKTGGINPLKAKAK